MVPGSLSLMVLTLANLNPPLFTLSYQVQFALFGGGILLLIVGLGAPGEAAAVRSSRMAFWELLLLCLITLLAFGLQLYRLEGMVHTLIDEFHTLRAVLSLETRNDILILSPYTGMASSPWLFPYLQTGTLSIFGHTLMGLRFVSILFGSFTIPALYLLAKCLFDRPTALIAALLLATFPPFIHLSRLALVNAADPFVGTMLFALLARGLRSKRRLDFVLAGIFLALSQYFYDGGKMLYPALAAAWLFILGITARRQVFWQGVVLMLLIALLVAGPIFLTWLWWKLPIFPRLVEFGSPTLDWGAILSLRDGGLAWQNYLNNNLLPPFLHLIQRPDTSYFYYGGETPLILGFMLPAFFLGLVHALWRWRVAGSLLLIWVALTVLGNSLLIEVANTWSARYMVVLPALALLMALGLRFTFPLLSPRAFQPDDTQQRVIYPSGRLRWAGWLMGAGVLAMVALQPLYYFGYHLPYYNQQIRPYYDHIDAFYRARLLPPDTPVIFVSDEPVPTDQFYTLGAFWNFYPLMTVLTSKEFTANYVGGLLAQRPAFFIEPMNTDAPAVLRAAFGDDAVEGPIPSPYNVPLNRQYALYTVSPALP